MSATRKGVSFWQASIVPFEIDPNFDRPDDVRDAIHGVETATNLRFVRRSRQENFLRFVNGQKCQSEVGAQGKPNQAVSCFPNGDVGALMHEIGHAVGLMHEHQRSDRDTFVEIHEENIEPGKEGQFEKRNDDVPLTDYDPTSLMHYSNQAFSANGQDTITPLDAAVVLGSGTLSVPDVAALDELYPNVGIVRRGDSGVDAAKRVSEIAVASDTATPARLVTAVRTNEGTPRLILWNVNAQGGVTRRSDSAAAKIGQATSISIARGSRFVTALRTEEGRLKLISWEVDTDEITRLESAEEKRDASLIRLLALSDTLLVTAFRRGDGGLTLITWRLENDGRIVKRSTEETTVGPVSEISLTRVRVVNNQHFVAATVATPSRMLTAVFLISSGGAIQQRGDSKTELKAGTLAETAIHPPTGLLVVSSRTTSGKLSLVSLFVSLDGSTIRSRGDNSTNLGGTISRNALMARPDAMLSAVRAENGHIKLIRWSVPAEGPIMRLGDSTLGQTGEVGIVRLAGDTGLPNAPVVTCVQTEDDDLRLVTWDDQPEHGELQP